LRTDRPVRPGARPEQRPGPSDRLSGGDLLYGRNSVVEALRGRRRPLRLFLAAGIAEDARIREILDVATRRGIPLERLPRAEVDELVGSANHQGVCLHASSFPYATLDDVIARPGTILVLDHFQDVQNVGTLLRAAEAAGVAGIVIARDRAADVTAATVSSSSGAVEHLSIAHETNLARSLEQIKAGGRWVLGLDRDANAVDLFEGSLPLPAALVVGSEGTGMTPIVKKGCDVIVSIPMAGRVTSLNASTAGAIALFELVRRTRQDR
jgi:23S rRNA (guanosine2251-2'-O)-methyltransferase